MRKSKLLMVLFSAAIALGSCSKDEPEPTNNNNNNNNNNNGSTLDTAKLCTGGADQSYMPLKADNKWVYKKPAGGNLTATITGTESQGGETFFKVSYDDGTNKYEKLYRQAGEEIYLFNKSNNTQYTEIPAAPSGNMEWPYPVGSGIGKRKVTSTNSNITTSKCTYTGCLVINETDASNNPVATYYYKKGFGLVRISAFAQFTDLAGITLK